MNVMLKGKSYLEAAVVSFRVLCSAVWTASNCPECLHQLVWTDKHSVRGFIIYLVVIAGHGAGVIIISTNVCYTHA